jgi:glutamate:Na+ symporter, ESS family
LDISLGIPATLAIAALVLVVGRQLIKRIGFLRKYSIPEPVVGGLLAAVLVAALHAMGVRIAFAARAMDYSR